MNPSIEAAWIAGSSGFLGVLVGVTGTAIVARIGFKSTRAATDATVAGSLATVRDQIEADRQSRIWEKRADAYTDFIAVIQHRQDVRQVMWREMVTGAELERPAATLDTKQVEARLIAYASNEVIRATQAAGAAGQLYEVDVAAWHILIEQRRMSAGPPPTEAREAAEEAQKEANRLDDALTDIIRAELHAGTDQVPAPPVPLAPTPATEG